MGYTRSEHDEYVFFKVAEVVICFVALYVDNFFVFTNSLKEKGNLRRKMSERFPITFLGLTQKCLGMTVTRQNGAFFLDQAAYSRFCRSLEWKLHARCPPH